MAVGAVFSLCWLLIWVFVCPWMQWTTASRTCNITGRLGGMVSRSAASGAMGHGRHRGYRLACADNAVFASLCSVVRVRLLPSESKAEDDKEERQCDLEGTTMRPNFLFFSCSGGWNHTSCSLECCCSAVLFSQIAVNWVLNIIWQMYLMYPSLIWLSDFILLSHFLH